MSRLMKLMALILLGCLIAFLAACGSNESVANEKTKAEANSDSTNAEADSLSVNSDSTKNEKDKKDKKGEKPEEDAVPVEAITIKAGNVSSSLLYSATIETEEEVDVFPQVTGIIERILVEEGDVVKKSDVLVQLDDDEYRLMAEKAKVNYEQAMSDYKRSKQIFEKKLISDNEYETARFTMEKAKIEWEQAELTLERCKIKTPIPGVVAERFIKSGDRILTSTKLFHVVNHDRMIATVHIPAKDAQLCEKGQRVIVTSDVLGNKNFEGWVKRQSPVIDAQSGTMKITVGIKPHQHELKAGMFVNVFIITGTHEDVPLVPKNAIVYDGEKQFVFTISEDSLAHRIHLKSGYSDPYNIEALEGVEVGDKMVIVGQSALKDKTRVRVVRMDSVDVVSDSLAIKPPETD